MALSILLLIFFTVSGCSLKQDIVLDRQGGGTLDVEFSLKGFYLDFLNNFIDIQDSLSEIETELNKNPYLDHIVVKNPSSGVFTGSFHFSDLQTVFAETKEINETKIFSTSEKGNIKTIEIRLNRDNFGQLAALIPILDDPYLSSFGPEGSKGQSEQDYIDMVEWTFEDSETYKGEAVKTFSESVVRLSVKVDGTVISQIGGKRVSGSEVVYEIPLIKLLILDKELFYQIKYKV